MAGTDSTTPTPSRNPKPRPRAQSFDRALGAAIRRRRILLGLSQQQFGDLIGVTYQQAHKYETGRNRIAAGRLHGIAQALEWSVAELLAEVETEPAPSARLQRRLHVAADYAKLSERHADAVAHLVRALVEPEDAE
jgi:transcriptional regulator with XRE-family HTH domain